MLGRREENQSNGIRLVRLRDRSEEPRRVSEATYRDIYFWSTSVTRRLHQSSPRSLACLSLRMRDHIRIDCSHSKQRIEGFSDDLRRLLNNRKVIYR